MALSKFLKNNWKIIILILTVIIFWYPILFNNSFFMDDLGFIKVFESGKASFSYFFEPHNEHFMPIFKFIFFALYKIFGANIHMAMMLQILMHIINVLLFYALCKLIFDKYKILPFLAALIFATNSAYFEVLHWFTILSTSMSLCFLQISLISLHYFIKNKDRRLYWLSVFVSFLAPMNFSLGLLAFVFIVLYYFLIIRRSLNLKNIKKDMRLLAPYFVVWIIFLLVYAIFVFRIFGGIGLGMEWGQKTLTYNPLKILEFVIFGFLGSILKSFGFASMVFPYSVIISVLLFINLFFFLYFLFLYYILNNKKERIKSLGDRYVLSFTLISALLSYLVVAITRAHLGVEAFLSWGRYHFFPIFFLTIFLANCINPVLNILKKVFTLKRIKVFMILIFVFYLLMHFMLIRQKSSSSFRIEGCVPAEKRVASDTILNIPATI